MTISVPGTALVKRLSFLEGSIKRTLVMDGGPEEFFLQPGPIRPAAIRRRGNNNFFIM
jgi:hypothetical protein